jgi:hypothetical protein
MVRLLSLKLRLVPKGRRNALADGVRSRPMIVIGDISGGKRHNALALEPVIG